MTEERPAATAYLPDVVRHRLVALASDRLGSLDPDEVPAALRPFARFAPQRRARLAAAPLAVALETDDEFRGSVADELRKRQPDLADALEQGDVPPVADPLDVAVATYLLRSAGWERMLADAVAAAERAAGSAASASAQDLIERLQEQLASTRAVARTEGERLRAEVETARAEIAVLRKQLRGATDRARRAEAIADKAQALLEQARTEAAATLASSEAEARRLRTRLTEAEAALETARRGARESRAVDEVRLRVLLDAVLDAAAGLRRELALPPRVDRPADLVVGAEPAAIADVAASGRAPDDPALLDELLAIPQAHLVVDGYNVTKTGYGELTLESQRGRLVAGLAGLAARTRAEITCVFDGAERPPALPGAPRNVRVLFSLPGETADDVIRRLVAAEPPGRAVIVVSSDREVADAARGQGARPVPAALLLRRLERS